MKRTTTYSICGCPGLCENLWMKGSVIVGFMLLKGVPTFIVEIPEEDWFAAETERRVFRTYLNNQPHDYIGTKYLASYECSQGLVHIYEVK